MATQERDFVAEHIAEPTVDDVVGAVFAYSGVDWISSDRRLLQSFFYKLASDERLGTLSDDFEFSTDRGLFPFSRVLAGSLARLQMGKIIFARNPDFDSYGMHNEGREAMQTIAERVFDSQQQQLLKEAATAFVEYAQRWQDKSRLEESSPLE